MEDQAALLQRYRADRRKLLQFLLSSSAAASLSSVDFDTLSADYVLHRLKSGEDINVGEATKARLDNSAYPVMIDSKVGSSYFLVSDPDVAGSPPRRVPPQPPPPLTEVEESVHVSSASSQMSFSNVENVKGGVTFEENDYGLGPEVGTSTPTRDLGSLELPPLGLRGLIKGLSDDDLRESAFELLLASIFFSGVEMHPVEDKKKEKSPKFLSSLKSKRDKTRLQPQTLGRHSELMDIVRVQMHISEAMDACTRRNLMQLAARRMSGRIDLPHIILGLLNGTFRSDFPNEKSYMQWKSRQANILEELLCASSDAITTECLAIRSYFAKIRDLKEWDTSMSPSERVAVLASIRQVAEKISSLTGKFGIEGENYYWTAGYHLNVRLYQKLLYSVFDILDEDQLIEEADDMLLLIKLTWSTLGITQKIHNALYGWVLFEQFTRTGGVVLLETAVLKLQKVLKADDVGSKERQYRKSLECLMQCGGTELKLNLVRAIVFSISIWCDTKLQDYHLHFSKNPTIFRTMMTLVSRLGVLTSDASGEIKLTKLNARNDDSIGKLRSYVKSSTKAAYKRVASKVAFESKVERTHPLALLAKELKIIAEIEFNVFFPVLRQWCPECIMTSVVQLHHFFGERLKPFLKGVSSLSEDSRSVLPAADLLDRYLTQVYNSSPKADGLINSLTELDHYQIGEISKPFIIDWVISQHTHILEWTGRAFDIEDWEPLSFHQKQAASVVEVFRIIEETVDQFFGLNLPMDITHLQALLSVIFHSLDTYLLKMLNQLVEKTHLYPPPPPLTRYAETVMPMFKKRLLEQTLVDKNVSYKLNGLTIPKLCVRLNTLHYIQKQVGMLEEGIRKSWALVRPFHCQRWSKISLDLETYDGPAREHPLEDESLQTRSEEVDALFATTLNIISDTSTDAIKKLCDFAGARVVFWDMRETFLSHLYREDVESSRLETFIPHFDRVLNHICGLIDDALRDLVALSVCRASLEGYVWVLLDGGPSRSFSDSDAILMEEDLNLLKEFFVADGEGLPRSIVEQEAKLARQVLSLFHIQTETIIQMLMNASEHISLGLESHKHGCLNLEDAHTLVRILCHKKDREASRFLKRQYELPTSSEYDDTPSWDSSSGSPLISDILKRTTSFHWSKTGESSFVSMKKKLQEATAAAW